jgi:hypothetical protein
VNDVAVILEAAAKDSSADAPWQGLFALVQLCVATSQNHLMRALPPSSTRDFAALFDVRVAKLALRSCGLWQAADSISSLQGRVIGLPSCWGGLSIRSISSIADAAYVGAAALIGPAVKGLVAETDFSADSIYRTELQEALARLQTAIALPNPRPQSSEDTADEEDDTDESDAAQPPDLGLGQAAPQPKITTKYLRSITADNIYTRAVPRIQRALAAKSAALEAVDVHKVFLAQGDLAGAARFVDRWQRGASAWLHATRKDDKQSLKNQYFRVAVGRLVGINCFADVPPETPCPLCKTAVGPDVIAHTLSCRSCRTGDNNRRHQAIQQILLYLLRLAGATVVTTPGVQAWTGTEPADPSHQGRMLDLGARGLDNGPELAIDLCVSDCGSGNPSPNYKTGAKAAAKGRGKRKTYGVRFPAVPADELCFPSYGSTGTKDTNAVGLHKRIINAIASANPTTPYSIIAQRVHRIVSVAIQQAFAYNALNFACTKLSTSKRVVGGGAEMA